VTDDKDRRYLLCCLADFYNVLMFDDTYKLSPSGVYTAPPGTPDFEQMVEHTLKLPLTQQPEVRAHLAISLTLSLYLSLSHSISHSHSHSARGACPPRARI
jgi:hypothetical protein